MVLTVIILFVGALVIATAMTPVSKWLAPRMGVMDKPNARKIHASPVPRMGGVAIFVAVMVVVALFGGQQEIQQSAAILFGAAFMSFLGLADDRFTLSAYLRLALQLGAAVFVWFAGVRIQMFSIDWLDGALTVLWIVGISNAMNFLDNMDGLLAGISAVMSGFFMVLAVLNGQVLVATFSAALMGACIGFLFWNLNPASVFMGDSGSMFLGFLLACVAIKLRFVIQTPSVSWMVPLIVMALPIFDTTMVVISRLRRGKNPLTTPGKDHTSHRIADHGFSRREAVMMLYLVCCALGMVALLVSVADVTAARVLGIAVAVVAAYMLWYMEFGPWKLKTIPDQPLKDHQTSASQ